MPSGWADHLSALQSNTAWGRSPRFAVSHSLFRQWLQRQRLLLLPQFQPPPPRHRPRRPLPHRRHPRQQPQRAVIRLLTVGTATSRVSTAVTQTTVRRARLATARQSPVKTITGGVGNRRDQIARPLRRLRQGRRCTDVGYHAAFGCRYRSYLSWYRCTARWQSICHHRLHRLGSLCAGVRSRIATRSTTGLLRSDAFAGPPIVAVPFFRPLRMGRLVRLLRLARVGAAVVGEALRRGKSIFTHNGFHFDPWCSPQPQLCLLVRDLSPSQSEA